MKKRKSFDWYSLRQTFSIRKYHFGAASVLLGTSLVLGGAPVQADSQIDAANDTQTQALVETAPSSEALTQVADQPAQSAQADVQETSQTQEASDVATSENSASQAAVASEAAQASQTAQATQETAASHATQATQAATNSVLAATPSADLATAQTASDSESAGQVNPEESLSIALSPNFRTVNLAALIDDAGQDYAAISVENAIEAAYKEEDYSPLNRAAMLMTSLALATDSTPDELVHPERTPVRNASKLSEDEKAEVKAAVIAANPFINTDTTKAYQDTIEIGDDGGVTVMLYDENDGTYIKSLNLSAGDTVVSRTVFNTSLALSRTTIGKDGDTNGITLSLNLTASKGDTYTIKIPKSSIYSLTDGDIEKLNGIGSTKLTSDDNFYYITNTIETGAAVKQNIVLSEVNNYKQQAEPMTDLGTISRSVTLSGRTTDGYNLGSTTKRFETIIEPSMKPDTSRQAPSSKTVKYVAVGTDYTYVVNVNEANGVKDDEYPSTKVNASVNYGTTITVPVPASFTLNEAATLAKNAFNDATTIAQPGGAGSDIIITVPKGSGDQNWEGKAGYLLVGSYDREAPDTDTTVTADRPITVVQKLNDEGSKTLEATAGPWTENLRGKDSDQPTGDIGVGAENALISSTLLLDENTANDPAYLNAFSFANNSIYSLDDAVLTIEIADGLDATGIKVPQTSVNLPSTTSYAYTLTYADGSQSTGTVNAGETVMRTGNSAIRKAEFKPDVIGATEATEAARESDNKNGTKNQFEILGTLSATYDNGTAVKGGDQLTSQISLTSPKFKDPKTGAQQIVSAKTTQSVISADDLKAAINGYRYQGSKVPGVANAGYIAPYNEANPNETTHEMLQPTFYYVLPRHTSYDQANSYYQDSPTVETYDITDSAGFTRQVVKVDYSSQTGYYFRTDVQASANHVALTNDNTAQTGTYPIEVYVKTSTNMLETKVSALKDFDTAITQGNVDKTYRIWNSNWVIQQASALYPAGKSQGNLDEGEFKNTGTSDDKGVTDMAFNFSIINALTTDSTNVEGYLNLPRKAAGSQFDFFMTGPMTTDYAGDYTILYATTPANMKAEKLSQITGNYVTADQVSDWSEVRSIYLATPLIASGKSLGTFVIPGQNPTVASDAGKTAGLAFVVNADGYDKLQKTAENTSTSPKITIVGQSTIKTVLEYEDANGVTQRLDLDYHKTYNDNKDTLKKSDFPTAVSGFGEADQAIINDVLALGYTLSSDFPATSLENGQVTWQDGEPNGTAAFGTRVKYDYDTDIVVYRLRPVIATVTTPPTPGTSQVPDIETGKDTPYPPTTPVPNGLESQDSYVVKDTAKRQVSYVFEGSGLKPVVADVVQTVAFEAPKSYQVNLVTGQVVKEIVGTMAPVSGHTSDNVATLGADGRVVTQGEADLAANSASIPAVSGSFEGWYLASETNNGQTTLQPGDDITGQLVYRRLQKADITYVFEDNDGTRTTLSTKADNGKPDQVIDFAYASQLSAYEGQGYILKSSDFKDGSERFDNDDTTDQHFEVVLVKVAIQAEDQISAGTQGQVQTETMTASFTKDLPNLSKISYSFEDGSQSKVVAGQGSYTLDAVTGEIIFKPEADFVGTATPVTVVAKATLTKTDGSTETISDTATYTPTVYGIKAVADTTSGRQGETQTSISGAERFSDSNTLANTPNGTKPDWTKASYSFADGSTQLEQAGQGTYVIDPATGVVTFTPAADFVGNATGVKIQVSVPVTDAEGQVLELTASESYQPTVYAIQGSDDTTSGRKGETQTSISGADRFSELNNKTNTPDGTNVDWSTARYTFDDGTTTKTVPGVGSYIIELTTGVVTFTPEADYVGTPDGVRVQATVSAKDAQGRLVSDITATGLYVPTVIDVRGQVVIAYEDENGNTIKDPVTDTPDSTTGTPYDTTDNDGKPSTIVTDSGKTYDLIPEATKGTEKGRVTEGTSTVTYVYREVKGSVVVHYTDEAGNVLRNPETDTADSSTGVDYDTTDHKPSRITTPDGKTYDLVPELTKGAETAQVVVGRTEVTYVYREVKGSVVVNYTDEAGNPLQNPVTDTPETSTGTPYETADNRPNRITTPDGKTYDLVPELTQGQETGKVTEGETQVTYVYREVKGDVVVNYVDESGRILQNPVTDTDQGSTGSDYDTTDHKPSRITTPEGRTYDLVPELTQGQETGKVTLGTTQVTYVYREVKGSVVVNYTDEDGNVIQDPVTDTTDSSTGVPYETTDHKPSRITTPDGKTYDLVPELTQGQETGKVTEGETTVTYVYREVKGDVVVNYVDEAGNVIQNPVTDTDQASTGSDYDTTDHKPNRIVTPDGKTYDLVPEMTQGAETGKVTEGQTQVTYVYREVKGTVVVSYTDEAGNPLQNPVTDTADASTGSDYDTTDHRPNRITTPDGKTYDLVPDLTKGTETGKVTEGETTVTYVYREVKGSVVVNYVDEAGNSIQAQEADTMDASTATPYDTTDHKPEVITTADGKTYVLLPDQTKGDEAGQVVEGTTEVTYVYRLKETDKPTDYPSYDLPGLNIGKVTVRYEDEAGQELQTPVEDTAYSLVDTDYDTTDHKPNRIITPDGKTYDLVPEATIGQETGQVTEGDTEVTYVYREVKGNVIVNYVDEAGNPIQASETDTQNSSTGEDYDTTDHRPSRITTPDGKTYDLVPEATIGQETGQVTEGDTEVTYVYREVKGSVVVNYTDEAGNVLQNPVTDTQDASTGTPYDTADHRPDRITTPDGKVYDRLPEATQGNESGQTTEGQTEVTYVYREVKGNVIVNYVDESGQPIQASVMDSTDASVATPYETYDHKPSRITTPDGKTYSLVPEATIGQEKGQVTEGDTEVTYVYREIKGSVIVNYEDESGFPIKRSETDSDSVSTGSPYDTTDHRPSRITTPDGKTYELVPELTRGTETGKITEGNSQVTYVYREVKGNVIVNYVDEAGTPIKASETDTANSSTGRDYETYDHKPSRITTPDGKTYDLIPEATIGQEKGQVTEGDTEVTYVYREVKGSVIVNYVDESGQPIQDPETDTPDSSTGTPYDTTDHRPGRITTPDGKTYELVPELTRGTETGKITEGNSQVTYVYREVKGNVIVNYVDEAGNPIQASTQDTIEASTGTSYDTTDHKPSTITTADGKVYVLIPEATQGAETGTVTEGDTEVTYVYREQVQDVPGDYPTIDQPSLSLGRVKVHYVDEAGNEIKSPVTDTAWSQTGGDYDTTDHKPSTITTADGKVYVLIPEATQGVETGSVTEGETSVTYVYREQVQDVPGDYPTVEQPSLSLGRVKVHYVDEAGNEIKSPVTDTAWSQTGGDYDTTDHKPSTITITDGKVYVLIPEATQGVETGSVTEGETSVTYVYREQVQDIPGDYPTVEQPSLNLGRVKVHYVDETGTEIKSPVTDTAWSQTGGDYDTTDHKPSTITTADGKVYVLIPEATQGVETGSVTEGETSVTYVYREQVQDVPGDYPTVEQPSLSLGRVKVHYVDEAGNEIKSPVTDTAWSQTGGDYDTTDHKPSTITTADGKVYVLIPEATQGVETGSVTEGETSVTYVYREQVQDVPGDYPTVDLPEGNIGIVPGDYPTVDLPEGNISIVPGDYPTVDLPEGNIGIVPGDYPTVDLPEGNIGIVPGDYPTVDLPEGNISIVPGDYPTVDLPEGKITDIPNTTDLPGTPPADTPNQPSVDLPETSQPQRTVPSVALETDPIVSPAPAQAQAGQLPQTGDESATAMALVGAGALLAGLALAGKRRKGED